MEHFWNNAVSEGGLDSGGANATQGFKNERDKRYHGSLAGCMMIMESPFPKGGVARNLDQSNCLEHVLQALSQ